MSHTNLPCQFDESTVRVGLVDATIAGLERLYELGDEGAEGVHLVGHGLVDVGLDHPEIRHCQRLLLTRRRNHL